MSLRLLVLATLCPFGCALFLRSSNTSSLAVGLSVRACDEGLKSLKEKLRDDHNFPIPTGGTHTWEVEGGADAGLFDYLGELSRAELASVGKKGAAGTVCETGFNYGTSAYAFLCSTEAEVFSWDLGHHAYINPASELVSQEFPERHHLTLGDSRTTLTAAAQAADRGPLRARHCDVVYVDGGHTQEVATSDITNFATLSRPGALVVVDDCHHGGSGHIQGVTDAFQVAVQAGKVLPLPAMAKKFTQGRSICVGRFPKALAFLGKR